MWSRAKWRPWKSTALTPMLPTLIILDFPLTVCPCQLLLNSSSIYIYIYFSCSETVCGVFILPILSAFAKFITFDYLFIFDADGALPFSFYLFLKYCSSWNLPKCSMGYVMEIILAIGLCICVLYHLIWLKYCYAVLFSYFHLC